MSPAPPLPTTAQAIANVVAWLPHTQPPQAPVPPQYARSLLAILLAGGASAAVAAALKPTPQFISTLLQRVQAAHTAANYAGRLLAYQQFGKAAGASPPGPIGAADQAAGLAAVHAQTPYAQRFAQQLAAGKVSPAQAGARAGMYIAGARNTAILAWLGMVPRGSELDWALGLEVIHCVDCPRIATINEAGSRLRPPYTIETLPTTPRFGDTECLMYCRCDLIYLGYRSP